MTERMMVGIHGKKGSGKDSLSRHMINAYGYKDYAFALPIKRAICSLLGIGMEWFEDRTLKEEPIPGLGVSPRYLAQTGGTDWLRKMVREDIFIVLADWEKRKMEKCGHDKFIFPDVRFDNEAEWIRSRGGVIIEVYRPGLDDSDTHASEAGISDYLIDHTIVNDGTLQELYDKGEVLVNV